jgi:TPR repeat protein
MGWWWHFSNWCKDHPTAAALGFLLAIAGTVVSVLGSYGMLPLQVADDDKAWRASIEAIRQSAGQGDANAQLQLGKMYEYGDGVPQNDTEAFRWYKLAADQGNASGQVSIGNAFSRGIGGVAQDSDEAMKWYRRAAEQGSPDGEAGLGKAFEERNDYQSAMPWLVKAANHGSSWAEIELGLLLEEGHGGVPRNYGYAMQWFLIAARRGDAEAGIYIAEMYQNGWGMKVDYKEAMRWLQMAADRAANQETRAAAQFRIGSFYDGNHGFPKDPALAANWMRQAAGNGSKEAGEWLTSHNQ